MPDATQAFRVLLVLLRVEVNLRRRPLPEAAARLGVQLAREQTAPPAAARTAEDRRDVRRVDRALRYWPWKGTCLRRSLAVGALQQHADPVLHIGAAAGPHGPTLHAWLTVGDQLLTDDPADLAAFTRLRAHRP